MAIPFQCHQCGGQFAAPDQLAGKKAKCQRCGAVVQVPQAAHSADPLNAAGSGHLAAQAFAAAMAGQPVDPFQSAGTATMQANPYSQGGADLHPAMQPSSGSMPWGWILGGGAALIILAGCAGLIMTLSSMLPGPRPNPGPLAANLPNQPVVNPAVPRPAERPRPAPAPAPVNNVANANPTSPVPAPGALPEESHPTTPFGGTGATSGDNPFESAETVALPNRPMGLPKGEELDNPFGEDAKGSEAAAPTEADVTKPTGWALRPDPPPVPVEYKKGKISIPFPRNAELCLPNGPSHFALGTVREANNTHAFQVFDLRTGKAIGKQVFTQNSFSSNSAGLQPRRPLPREQTRRSRRL